MKSTKPKSFATAGAFKESLEQRLRNTGRGSADLARRRQLVVFDRFLARVAQVFGDAVIVKGGVVLELRLERARTTKDIDLRLTGRPAATLPKLQTAGRVDLADFMTFEVQLDPQHPKLQNQGMVYEGERYRVEAKLVAKLYSRPFSVDVVFAEPMVGEPDIVAARNLLDFAGIAPTQLRLYPVESHLAEKFHAYSMPRTRENSRVKDLPDIALLGKVKRLVAATLRDAIRKTFASRRSHDVPTQLAVPPAS